MGTIHRRLYAAALGLLPVGLPAPALAEAGFVATPAATPAATHTATPAGLTVGIAASDYRYEEPGLMELTGTQVGARASYLAVDAAGKFGAVELLVSGGKLTYTGSGVLNNVPNFSYDGRLLFGAGLASSSALSIAPFAGIAYRYLYNDLRGTSSTGAVGYQRESNYLYLPIGAFGRYAAGEGWAVNGRVEVDVLVRGHQDSWLSDTGLALADVRNDQRKGYGVRAAVSLEKSGFSFGPWITYWDIADSKPSSPAPGVFGIEPKNRTREAGLDVHFRY